MIGDQTSELQFMNAKQAAGEPERAPLGGIERAFDHLLMRAAWS